MSFESATARMREKTLKQLQKNTSKQLEQETKKMEERIKNLKLQLSKEKEQRERGGGSHWKSGRTGTLSGYGPEVKTKKKTTRTEKSSKKIKILSDEPISSYIKKPVVQTQLEIQPEVNLTGGTTTCGQCETFPVTLVCLECGENYCQGCFDGFHQKGALKRHRAKPFGLEKDKRISVDPALPRHSGTTPRGKKETSCSGTSPTNQSSTHQTGGLLLQGSYDEKESAASFAEALAEWRRGKAEEKTGANNHSTKTTEEFSCGTSTEDDKMKKPFKPDIKFSSNSSLSYLDRLALKQHKQDPSGYIRYSRNCQLTPSPEARSPRLDEQISPGTKRDPEEPGSEFREMFQAFVQHSGNKNKDTSHGEQKKELQRPSVSIVEIIECDDNDDAEENCNYCVDEQPVQKIRPDRTLSRTGRVSIQELVITDIGAPKDENFRVPVVKSALGRSSPFSRNSSRQSVSKSPSQQIGVVNTPRNKTQSPSHQAVFTPRNKKSPNYRSSSSLSVDSSKKKTNSKTNDERLYEMNQLDRTKTNQSETPRASTSYDAGYSSQPGVWRPSTTYTSGISEFFLWGLKDEEKTAVNNDMRDSPRASVSENLERSRSACFLLHNASSVWRPTESITPEPDPQELQALDDSIDDANDYNTVPVIEEPDDSLDEDEDEQSVLQDSSDMEIDNLKSHVHDFGIVDFLKRSPVPSKNGEDYHDVHRVSAVSDIPLSSKPPPIRWGEEDSDEELVESSASRLEMVKDLDEADPKLIDEEDEEDRATIDDLAWELASSQGGGRQTQCDFEMDENENTIRDDYDDNSIADNDAGSGLSSPDELDDNFECEDDAMSVEEYDQIQKHQMEEEVQALRG